MRRNINPHHSSMERDPVGNIYYNASLTGPPPYGPTGGGRDGIVANYDVTRSSPILAKPSDFYGSIVRLTLNLNSAPIFVCPIIPEELQTPPFNKDLTPWVIGIVYQGVYYKQSLIWQTELPSPTDPNANVWYYFAWSLMTFVAMVNAAMKAAFDAFALANPATPQAAAGPPTLRFNPSNQLLQWVVPAAWTTSPTATPTLGAGDARVGINWALEAVFDGWRRFLVGESAYSFDVDDQSNYIWEVLGADPSSPAGGPYTFSQSFECITLISNLRKIVVTSSSIPMVQESITGPQTNPSEDSTRAIVTDFVPVVSLSGDVRGVVYYQPRAQYRLFDLISDAPFNRMQLSFWWESTDGVLYPITLARGAIAEVKLGFFRKTLYDSARVVKAIERL